MERLQSWGRFPPARQKARFLHWISGDLPIDPGDTSVLPYGLGRSYGDSCLNDGGTLLVTGGLDRFIRFDRETGILRCEAGVTLSGILDIALPAGWFLPVTPGTLHVTVGGAIANDVHGKNHHRAGTFGCHVNSFELLRSDGERLLCSPDSNARWYEATIGGLGLTGLVTWAEIRLKRVRSPYLATEAIRFGGIEEFFPLSEESDRDHEYTVAWVDCTSRGPSRGRGIFFRGNHAEHSPREGGSDSEGLPPSVPFDAPGFLLNGFSIRMFNSLYFNRQRRKSLRRTDYYRNFFYPLDRLGAWNRLYGKRGFFQYQCVVPHANRREAAGAVLGAVASSGQGSFLSVMKAFGDTASPGMLSFPRKGVTLSLDFPNKGADTLRLLERLDSIVGEAGGSVYPAKDARMSPRSFRAYYPRMEEFSRNVDPRFSSGFWRRVTGRGTVEAR